MSSVILIPHKTVNQTQSQTQRIKLTFEEYLNYNDHTDNRYELIRGNLVIMPNATALHTKIIKFLLYILQNHLAEIQQSLVAINDLGVRTLHDTVRLPDLIVCDLNLLENICQKKTAGVLDFGEKPQLVIEVTSQNWRDDYILKKAEYAMIEIPEYWIIDPNKQVIKICTNSAQGEYQFKDYLLGETIKSLLFPQLNLTVDEIITPPIVENLIKEEKQATEELKFNLDQEKLRADQEKLRADQEKLRADQEKLRAEKLVALLRANGIDPDLI